MSGEVSFLKPNAIQPTIVNTATHPALTDNLKASVDTKTAQVLALLTTAVNDLSPMTFANSFGAEDMVLTDIIKKNQLPIEIFSLDTGRLPNETYDLIAETERHYDTKLTLFFPQAATVEFYVKTNGINAFYESVELRKSCCHMRKVEPLQRALKDKKAYTCLRADSGYWHVRGIGSALLLNRVMHSHSHPISPDGFQYPY